MVELKRSVMLEEGM